MFLLATYEELGSFSKFWHASLIELPVYFLPKEEMVNLDQHLLDVLEAEEQGKSAWDRWFDRFASFYERKFGPDWQKEHGFRVR